MATGWVYVINDGSGVPRIVRSNPAAVAVAQVQAGEYVVSFPEEIRLLTCIATLNSSVGTVTVVPGDNSGLDANQVRVLTLSLNNELLGTYDFSLAVFCEG